MRVKMHVKKGDTVLVASGKYKGRVGKVKAVLPKKMAVIVEGVNLVKKAVRPSPKYPQGGFVEQEAPLHASKVRPICPQVGPLGLCRPTFDQSLRFAYSPSSTTNSQAR